MFDAYTVPLQYTDSSTSSRISRLILRTIYGMRIIYSCLRFHISHLKRISYYQKHYNPYDLPQINFYFIITYKL